MDWLWITLVALSLGSLLNVVIYRLPLMLQATWRKECENLLKPTLSFEQPRFNLWFPGSRCPHCKQRLKPYHLFPVLSYCCLKGRCASCQQVISWQYPLVEIITTILCLFVYKMVGFNYLLINLWVFTSLLICLMFIDLRHQLLPDVLNYLLLWSGLLTSCVVGWIAPEMAILGALLGYLIFWSIANLFKLITQREGLGYGDCKLIAGLGAWVGPLLMIKVILYASIIGIIVTLMLFKRYEAKQPIPFGPFLASAGWVTLIHHLFYQGFFS